MSTRYEKQEVHQRARQKAYQTYVGDGRYNT